MIPCGNGTYNPTANNYSADACNPCPPYSTSDAASASILECVCMAGYVDVQRDVGQPADCTLCSTGTECTQRNTTVSKLPVRVGWSGQAERLTRGRLARDLCAGSRARIVGPAAVQRGRIALSARWLRRYLRRHELYGTR